MAENRKFGGKVYFSAGWFYQKIPAQGVARYYRDRGFSARVIKSRNPGLKGRMGYEVFARGKGK